MQLIAYADVIICFAGLLVQHFIPRAHTFLVSFERWSDVTCLRMNARKAKTVLFRSRNKAVNNTFQLPVTLININFYSRVK